MRKGENKKGVEAEEGGDKGKMGALFQWLRGWGDRHCCVTKSTLSSACVWMWFRIGLQSRPA